LSTLSYRSLASGEITPSLYGRVDFVKYATGLRTCRNSIVMRHGGTTNRPGSKFIAEVKDSDNLARLIPFVFNASQTYMLEFGDKYMRVIQDGAVLTNDALSITAITQANPGVLTVTSHGLATDDEIYISGVGGMTELNGRNFKVVYIGANTFSLKYLDGTAVNTTSFTTYTSGGSVYKIYEITTPYLHTDLAQLQFVQSADVVTIVHPNYSPRELSRTGHTSWALSTISFVPEISAPTSVVNSGAAGTTTEWVVTAVASETFEESLPSSSTGSSATPSSGSPITVSWAAVSGAQEYNVYKKSNGIFGFIGIAGSTSFVDTGIAADTSDSHPRARDPFALETAKTITGITQASPAVVTITAHDLSEGDLIYIASVGGMTQINTKYYFVREVLTANTFSLNAFDGTILDSSAYTAYTTGGTAQRAMDYPSAVTYYQQRLMFANTLDAPETVFTSRTGNFKNFTTSIPTQDDDAITFTMAGKQVNSVNHMVDLGQLILFTAAGEWTAQGDASGILRPGEINPKQHTYNGSSYLAPIVIGGSALYVQGRGNVVRDLGFDYQVDGYRGNDLTIFSAHLLDGYELVDWSYQQIPHSVLWMVRGDGVLLGLTYVREQQLLGWHRHDFDGEVENVAVIPEGSEDSVYLVIKRTIDSRTVRYIEKFSQRRVDDIVDSIFMDSALSYDGRNTGSTTMTLTGSGWAYTDTLTLTASASTFVSTDVGNIIEISNAAGDSVRLEIVAYTSATVVSVKPNKTVPVALRSTALTSWTRAVDVLGGLWHLEGKMVSVLADGVVVANPNNTSYVEITVTDGEITLDRPYGVIHVGLPYTSDIETLDVDTDSSETLADKKKIVSKVSIFVEESRGIWAGGTAPEDDSLDGLTELKIRELEGYDSPVDLATGVVDINIRPEWNSNGRVFIRQTDPLPLSVLAVAPAGLYPFRKGG